MRQIYLKFTPKVPNQTTWGKCGGANVLPPLHLPLKGSKLEQKCGGPQPSLSHPHPHLPLDPNTQGANIIRGKWNGQNICFEVNIYPFNPNKPKIFLLSMAQF
jgi:uncharacterized Zn-finger protein